MLRVVLVVVLVLLAVGFGVETLFARSERQRNPAPGQLIRVDATRRLHINCSGSGSPAVIFESGSGGTSLDWSRVQPEIAKRTKTCSYDRAGYGWSDAADEHTLDRMSEDFEAVLRHAKIDEPYVLVAHSFGGLLTIDHASRHPDEIAGLVFVDAADKATYELMDERFPSFVSNGRRLATVTRIGSVATRFGITRLIGQPASPKTVDPEVADAYRAVGFQPKAYRAFTDDLLAFRSYVDDAEDAPRTDLPVAVLTHDDPGTMWVGVPKQDAEDVWQERQRELARRFGVRNEVITGAKHFIQQNRPGSVIEAIEEVLRAANR